MSDQTPGFQTTVRNPSAPPPATVERVGNLEARVERNSILIRQLQGRAVQQQTGPPLTFFATSDDGPSVAVPAGNFRYLPMPAAGANSTPAGAFTQNADSVTIRDAGVYLFTACGNFPVGLTAVYLSIGSTINADGEIAMGGGFPAGAFGARANVTGFGLINAGQKVWVNVTTDPGANISLAYLEILKVG